MHTKETFALTAFALVLSLGVAGPALASSTMCTKDAMAKGDTMAKADTMGSDAMAKGDAMATADDSMKKDDAMKGDAMAKTDTMAADAMNKDNAMATADNSMKSGTMMADYTVKMGDSLWSIAAATLCDGNRYHQIVEANADMLHGGMMIHPGEVLHIPGD